MKKWLNEMMKKMNVNTVCFMFLGVFFIGWGISLLRLSWLGTDPFTCMNLGVSSVVGMSFGNYQVLINLVLLVPMLIWGRKQIGLGTLINMFGCGYIVEICIFVYQKIGIPYEAMADASLLIRLLILAISVVITCLGVALYMECDLGISPYDASSPIIQHVTKDKVSYAVARIITDIICVAIGFFTGSVVGIGTIFMMFCTGPVVSFLRKNVAQKFVVKNSLE